MGNDLVEKPSPKKAPSNLAIVGRYILTPGIFDSLRRTRKGSGGEIQLTDGLKDLLSKEAAYAYSFKGRRFDAGSKIGFLEATVAYALKDRRLRRPFRTYLRSLLKK